MPDRLRNALAAVGERVEAGMTERDVATAAATAGVYEALGYDGPGVDVHAERRLPTDRRADAVLTDGAGGVVAVVEFKAPDVAVAAARSQVADYVETLHAAYGVVTNGRRLAVYSRDGAGLDEELTVELAAVTDEQARTVETWLGKRRYDVRDRGDVAALLDERDGVSLAESAGREFFFERFRLAESSSFGAVVTALVALLEETESATVQRDFEYWSATYASVPEETPESWQSVVGSAPLETFAFCLETAHALLARLLLAKATGDYGLFEDERDDWLRHALASTHTSDGRVAVGEYPRVARGYIEEMRESLVTAAFDDDIFAWWQAAIAGASDEGGPADRFGRAVGRLTVEVLRFDFRGVEGDLLGELYQQYFDPETRKALGEFYTPEPLAETMLDEVGYEGAVTRRRLIDPACGSGTFLVAAVERYLAVVDRQADGEPDWPTQLQQLCVTPRVVGLDVHPFAVLMARIRFVAAILPKYRIAKRQSPEFTLRRLPIYRTDALRVEPDRAAGEAGAQTGLGTFETGERDIFVPVPLPVEADGGVSADASGDGSPAGGRGQPGTGKTTTPDGFLLEKARMPRYRTVAEQTPIESFEEYFAAMQGLLDSVRNHLTTRGDDDGWDGECWPAALAERLGRYMDHVDPAVTAFFAEYADRLLASIQQLPERREDPQLVSLFDDTLLAVIIKNHLSYDYVVGNPPYVRSQTLSAERKRELETTYETTTGAYDLYCPFYERGLEWLTDGGRLAFVSPDGFLRTAYGRGLRTRLLDARVERIYDFRDSGVFADATNYPAVVVAAAESDPERRAGNDVRCVRVKSSPDAADGSVPANDTTVGPDDPASAGGELDERVLAALEAHRDEPGYDGRWLDVFDVSQATLDEEPWPLMPPDERRVFDRLAAAGDARLESVTDAVFQGLRTGANGVFVVRVPDAGRIGPDETGGPVRIVPTGAGEPADVERDLLRPFLAGRDVARWRGEWDGLHLLFPYRPARDTDEPTDGPEDTEPAELRPYTRDELREETPETFAYLTRHEHRLRGRDGADSDRWWAFARTQSLGRIGQPKTIGAEIADRATFAVDDEGRWAFTTAYGVAFDESRPADTLTAQLNARPLDFYLKHVAPIKRDGYYSYRAAFLEQLPVRTGELPAVRAAVEAILDALDTETRVRRFPGPYLAAFDGRVTHLTHEWQTTRRPVEAEARLDSDGRAVVAAGRTDRIRDPALAGPDRETTRRRGAYVARAVIGRRVRAGETTRVPIPVESSGVEQLLAAHEADRARLEEVDLAALEARVDRLVAEAFDLTESDRAVIERFLAAF